MGKTARRIYYKEILALFRQGKPFRGFVASWDVSAYELSEKGWYIDAKNKYEFVRQVYEGEEAIRLDNLFIGKLQMRYWRIEE